IEKTRKETRKETQMANRLKFVQVRCGDSPQSLLENIHQIDDISLLEQLLVSTISVSSLEEFVQLVNSNLSESD
ncbi:MAG: hypothetical protein ACK5S7_00005, partial [Dolichospermum sp.]